MRGRRIILREVRRAIKPHWAFLEHESTGEALARGVKVQKMAAYKGNIEKYLEEKLYGTVRSKQDMI